MIGCDRTWRLQWLSDQSTIRREAGLNRATGLNGCVGRMGHSGASIHDQTWTYGGGSPATRISTR